MIIRKSSIVYGNRSITLIEIGEYEEVKTKELLDFFKKKKLKFLHDGGTTDPHQPFFKRKLLRSWSIYQPIKPTNDTGLTKILSLKKVTGNNTYQWSELTIPITSAFKQCYIIALTS